MKSLNELSNAGNKYAIIKIDETEFWTDDIQKKADKIYCVYLVDLTEPTHCCELAISYPAESIKNFFENPKNIDEDKLTELELMEPGLGEISYLNGNSIYEISKLYKDKDMSMEDVREYEMGNPTVC